MACLAVVSVLVVFAHRRSFARVRDLGRRSRSRGRPHCALPRQRTRDRRRGRSGRPCSSLSSSTRPRARSAAGVLLYERRPRVPREVPPSGSRPRSSCRSSSRATTRLPGTANRPRTTARPAPGGELLRDHRRLRRQHGRDGRDRRVSSVGMPPYVSRTTRSARGRVMRCSSASRRPGGQVRGVLRRRRRHRGGRDRALPRPDEDVRARHRAGLEAAPALRGALPAAAPAPEAGATTSSPRLLFRVRVRDTQTGFKLDPPGRPGAVVLPRMLEKRYAFDLEFLVVARSLEIHARVRGARAHPLPLPKPG